MRTHVNIFCIILSLIGLVFCSYEVGKLNQRLEILDRAKKIPPKGCYSQEDMDIIIFGESQL